MRIIHVFKTRGDSMGVYKAVRELAIAQAVHGEEVHLVVDGIWPEDGVRAAGVTVHEGSFWQSVRTVRALVGPETIVHSHAVWSPFALLSLLLRPGVNLRFVLSAHGSLAREALKQRAAKKRAAWLVAFGPAIRRQHAIFATAEPERQAIEALRLGPPVAILPNTIARPDGLAIDDVVKQRVVGFIGRLHPIKGVKELVQAWSQVAEHFPDWHLRLVGPVEDFGYVDELRALASATSRVEIDDAVYGADKWRFLAECAVIAVPSRSENFCYVVAEALLAGTPVVASSAVPWPEIEKLGLGWRGDVEDFKTFLRDAMNAEEATRRAMAEHGRCFVEHHYGHAAIWRASLAAYRGVGG